uniref:Uncharacterized protein n=1 Tax=Megaselia scalaris TaxID=36166 RepID=T1GXS0_MEGSC
MANTNDGNGDDIDERAEFAYKTFNSFEGFTCNPRSYVCFPQITIPPKAIEEAKKEGKTPDAFYAFELLESSGICILTGSGFGKHVGKIMLEKFQKFHAAFMDKYK